MLYRIGQQKNKHKIVRLIQKKSTNEIKWNKTYGKTNEKTCIKRKLYHFQKRNTV